MKLLNKKVNLGLIALLFALSSWSQNVRVAAPENNRKYAFYYQFADKSLSTQKFRAPLELITEALSTTGRLSPSINLMIWNLVSKPLPVAPEPYDRKKHFGDWIVDGRNGNCLNVRAVVLVRDSLAKVVMVPGNNCYVQSGRWYDPYGNNQYAQAVDIQIDHFVPLKHIYISGGFSWDAHTKCLYSNYLGYRAHLVPISSTENLKKTDGTPYSYLPPNKSFICNYLVNWLKIKKIWNLALIPPEIQAIAKAFTDNRCEANQFNMTIEELVQQRKYMNDNYKVCDYDVSYPSGVH